MTPAAHQHPQQAGHPGGAQHRLRAGAGDHHPQLCAAGHHAAALPVPRRRLQRLHRAVRRQECRGRAPARHRAARGRTARPEGPAEECGCWPTRRASRRPPVARRSPPSAAMPTTPCASSPRRWRRPPPPSLPPSAMPSRAPQGLVGTTGTYNYAKTDHLGPRSLRLPYAGNQQRRLEAGEVEGPARPFGPPAFRHRPTAAVRGGRGRPDLRQAAPAGCAAPGGTARHPFHTA